MYVLENIFSIYYIYHKYIFVCISIMCMYVYCSYNESKNQFLNIEIYYSNLKIKISVMKCIHI